MRWRRKRRKPRGHTGRREFIATGRRAAGSCASGHILALASIAVPLSTARATAVQITAAFSIPARLDEQHVPDGNSLLRTDRHLILGRRWKRNPVRVPGLRVRHVLESSDDRESSVRPGQHVKRLIGIQTRRTVLTRPDPVLAFACALPPIPRSGHPCAPDVAVLVADTVDDVGAILARRIAKPPLLKQLSFGSHRRLPTQFCVKLNTQVSRRRFHQTSSICYSRAAATVVAMACAPLNCRPSNRPEIRQERTRVVFRPRPKRLDTSAAAAYCRP